ILWAGCAQWPLPVCSKGDLWLPIPDRSTTAFVERTFDDRRCADGKYGPARGTCRANLPRDTGQVHLYDSGGYRITLCANPEWWLSVSTGLRSISSVPGRPKASCPLLRA
ncbi:MAG: hypothetical protein ACXADY_27325, partial [Candidatus Hodarchaeales archaeon]